MDGWRIELDSFYCFFSVDFSVCPCPWIVGLEVGSFGCCVVLCTYTPPWSAERGRGFAEALRRIDPLCCFVRQMGMSGVCSLQQRVDILRYY
jgi:hypothetical protein